MTEDAEVNLCKFIFLYAYARIFARHLNIKCLPLYLARCYEIIKLINVMLYIFYFNLALIAEYTYRNEKYKYVK